MIHRKTSSLISMTVPIRNRTASALACLLVGLAVVASPSCKSNNPSPEQTTESATQKMRKVISSDVAEAGRREQMLKLVDKMEAVQTAFNKDITDFVTKYQTLNADYDATRAAFDQLFSQYNAERIQARSQTLDLHFQLASLATDREWDRIGEAEAKMYDAIEIARSKQEEIK
jgi:uncharacterized protein YozE (UPF0346 family)